ncbi:hypothetical protein [Ekhidna sp.]|uniref:hypothetical protein n=1 Tax=Ekhidna sp. TaxID=2608089 RepID=UPI003B5BAABF
MRDTNEHMIELLDTSRTNNAYSATVQLEVDGTPYKVKFGIQIPDYSNLKRILEYRPFENTGVAPYRYFFALSYSNDSTNEELANIAVRVEQLGQHKQYEFTVTKKFIANLLWFNELENIEPIHELIITE